MKLSNIISLLCILFCSSCANNEEKKSAPEAKYLNDTFDFKKIKQGDIVDVSFDMKNVGNSNLIIKSSSVGCGCTKLASLKDTIAPGEITNLKLVYDSKSDTGNVIRTFVIETNSNPKLHVLFIKGFVQ